MARAQLQRLVKLKVKPQTGQEKTRKQELLSAVR